MIENFRVVALAAIALAQTLFAFGILQTRRQRMLSTRERIGSRGSTLGFCAAVLAGTATGNLSATQRTALLTVLLISVLAVLITFMATRQQGQRKNGH